MPHSLGQVYVHLVVPTQDRIPALSDKTTRGRLHGYMTGIFRNLESPSLRIGGSDDHVHALFRLSRVRPIVQVVQEVKKGSSLWLYDHGVKDFRWQDSYGSFSVSPQNVDKAIHYIENQELRHLEETFADEYRRIVHRCGGFEHEVAVHLVFSTKNRFPFLTDKAIRELLHSRLARICETAVVLACVSAVSRITSISCIGCLWSNRWPVSPTTMARSSASTAAALGGRPAACSGDMARGVPTIRPGWESAGSPGVRLSGRVAPVDIETTWRASPKSRTFTRPGAVRPGAVLPTVACPEGKTMTFSVLRSR